MILPENVSIIGHVTKTHGVNGEMCISVPDSSLCECFDPGECLIFDLDGIYVPFFVASSRPRGTLSVLVTLDGEDTQQKAAAFVGKEVYIESYPCDEDEDEECDVDLTKRSLYASDMIGFMAYDGDKPLGRIVDLYDNGDNPLFDVYDDETQKHILIPVVNEFIADINLDILSVKFDLPDGLLDL